MADFAPFLFTFGLPLFLIVFLLYCYSFLYKNTKQIHKQPFLIRTGILLFIFTMIAYDLYPPLQTYSPGWTQDWIKLLLYALCWTILLLAVVKTHMRLPDDIKQKNINFYLFILGLSCAVQYLANKSEIINEVCIKGPINYVTLFVWSSLGIILMNWMILKTKRDAIN